MSLKEWQNHLDDVDAFNAALEFERMVILWLSSRNKKRRYS